MADVTSQHFCPYCGRMTLHVMSSNTHGAGCLLTGITFGLAAPLWWIMVKQQTRCSVCGTSRASAKHPTPPQPANPPSNPASLSPTGTPAAKEKPTFYVEAAHRETGEIKTFKVKASSPTRAEAKVAEAGYLASSTKPVPVQENADTAASPPDRPAQTPRQPASQPTGPADGFAKASLFFGVPGICCFPAGIAAIVLGLLAILNAGATSSARTMSYAGIVMGTAGLLLTITVAISNDVFQSTSQTPARSRTPARETLPDDAIYTQPTQQDDPQADSLIGRWRDDSPFAGSTITITRSNGQFSMRQEFQDGSTRTIELAERRSDSDQRFDPVTDTPSGDHYMIDSRGNLEIRDEDGLIATARKVD